MKRVFWGIVWISWLALCGRAQGQAFTTYQYLTNNEVVPFQTGDTLWGPVRSNDYISIIGRPVFYDYVITSKERLYIAGNADPYFARAPILNAPPVRFLRTANTIRGMGQWVDGRDGRMMTRLKLRGGSIEVHQYVLGTPPKDSLIWVIPSPAFGAIFVNGQVEIEGVISGNCTIGSSGDMWLIGDIRYSGSDPYTGDFDDDTMPHMLGLVSEGNIIIANNAANGKNNGYGNDSTGRNIQRHSIIINGSLIALNESFTFQHQNDTWDMYQGPSPDERGIIHLKGSLAQWRRGYVHRSNHGGTGYTMSCKYNSRLLRTGPPGFGPGEYPDVSGSYYRLTLGRGIQYFIRDATIENLTITEGAEIYLQGMDALRVTGRLIANGSEEDPILIKTDPFDSRSGIVMIGDQGSAAELSWVKFAAAVTLDLQTDSITAANCEFGGEARFRGLVRADSCSFPNRLEVTSWDEFRIQRCIFNDGIAVRGNVEDGKIWNNTIVGGRDFGIDAPQFRSLDIRNNIIAFNRIGVQNRNRAQVTLEFNDVFGNRIDDYYNCAAGTGSIAVDPLFLDQQGGDYHLWWNSPCRDAGDPNSPRDPDGTRADIGAHYVDRLAVNQEPQLPGEFGMALQPNPFNGNVVLKFEAPEAGAGYLAVFDATGRVVLRRGLAIQSGGNETALDGTELGAAGVYIFKLEYGGKAQTAKGVFMP